MNVALILCMLISVGVFANTDEAVCISATGVDISAFTLTQEECDKPKRVEKKKVCWPKIASGKKMIVMKNGKGISEHESPGEGCPLSEPHTTVRVCDLKDPKCVAEIAPRVSSTTPHRKP